MRKSRNDILKSISAFIDDRDIQEELAEAVSSAYQFLNDEQLNEISNILLLGPESERIKRTGILAICNE